MKALSLIGLFLNFIGAIVLAAGLVKSPDQIEKESGTHYGHNPHLKKSMYYDRKAAIWGISIMAVGFVISILSEALK